MARRSWLYVPATTSGPTVLYRIDGATSSEIWIAEGSRQTLLGAYDYQVNYFTNRTPRTHLGGIFRDGQGLSDDAFKVDVFNPIQTSNTNPYTGTTTQSTNQSITWDITDPLIRLDFTYDNSFGTDALIRYAIPAGDYRADAETTAAITEVQNQTTGTARSFVELDGIRIYDTQDSVSGSPVIIADNQYGTPRIIPVNPTETSQILLASDNFTGTAGGSTFYEVRLESQLISLDFRFRPLGYIAKGGSTRYVGVEYFDSQGRFATDYFAISSNLTFTKTTALYPAIPTPATADPGRFWITKDRNGLGVSFTLADGQAPNPAFNIVNDRLVAVAGYTGTSQYNIPIGQTFLLNRTYDGVTTQIQVPGLGVEPSKVLGVADVV